MNTTLWLASASPRRRTLLEGAGYQVEVQPSHAPEDLVPGEAPNTAARRLATLKCDAVPSDQVAVAADTLVHLDGVVLNKPIDRTEARAHLTRLSGRWHEVTTGVCVRYGPASHTFAVSTAVRFRDLTAGEIDAYIGTGEADDKAGAYGIQGLGGGLVAEVRGSWTNVMGLPVEEVIAALRDLGGAPLEAARVHP